jgi:hypothetical protein
MLASLGNDGSVLMYGHIFNPHTIFSTRSVANQNHQTTKHNVQRLLNQRRATIIPKDLVTFVIGSVELSKTV